ncbi:hypothetical protein ACFYXD_35440 [Streptomyces platensis]|uniref:hypothetical protein n=1 Tax=Streptomyces platensis TaxID=58346 RepID=UPI0036C39D09
MTALTPDDLSGTYYGIGVLDQEGGAVAATHDPGLALAAIHAHYRITGGDLLSEWGIDPTRDFQKGWGWLEPRADGNWLHCAVDRPDSPDAFPATWLCL